MILNLWCYLLHIGVVENLCLFEKSSLSQTEQVAQKDTEVEVFHAVVIVQ